MDERSFGYQGGMHMHIERLKTGMIEENCYLVYNEEALLIIDPGEDAERIKQEIKKTNQQPVAILLTHTHYDHIGAVEPLRAYYQIPVYVSPLEQKWLGDPISYSYSAGETITSAISSCLPSPERFKIGSPSHFCSSGLT